MNSSDWKTSWQTTTTRNQPVRSARRKIRSIGSRPSKVATLRAEAIQISMRHLTRLRPYASNYPRMVSAVRTYWHKNITRPNASRLTATIMQHVQARYRFFIRGRLYAGVTKGINVLKKKLR
ncbi:MAG: hypothetical protein L3J67_06745 [Hyphomicrobiaceae bacterium]|nr:hypothetical protein [Hyphomicrobiaceae bacterium]